MCVKTNTTEKSYLIGLSELDGNFYTINTCKDDSDNNRFCWTFSIKKCIFAHRKLLTMRPYCLFLEIFNYQGHPYLMRKSSNIFRIM